MELCDEERNPKISEGREKKKKGSRQILEKKMCLVPFLRFVYIFPFNRRSSWD